MASKTFTLTLVRHGQTTHNKLKIIQGQMDTHLTDLGREQAKMLARYLEKTQEKFDIVFSSDLTRAYETCELISNGHYEIFKDQLLRERSFGILQGSPLSMLKTEALKCGYDDSNFTQFRPEGGETMDEVQERINKFCKDGLFSEVRDSMSILIVTHGGVVREFMKLFKKLGCNLTNKDMIVTPNTAMNRFEIKLTSDNQVESILAKGLHQIPHLSDVAKHDALNEEQLNDASMKKDEVEYAI